MILRLLGLQSQIQCEKELHLQHVDLSNSHGSIHRASFRAASDSRPFIIHIEEEEFVAIDEDVLCTRFRFFESTLLVEREELDENESIVKTVYVRPISTDRGLQFRVGTGSYTVMGAQSNLGLPQSSNLLP